MTYTVKTTMPDGNVPDLPPMSETELRSYLAALNATPDYDGEDLPDTGQAKARYENPDDTTIEWSPVAE